MLVILQHSKEYENKLLCKNIIIFNSQDYPHPNIWAINDRPIVNNLANSKLCKRSWEVVGRLSNCATTTAPPIKFVLFPFGVEKKKKKLFEASLKFLLKFIMSRLSCL